MVFQLSALLFLLLLSSTRACRCLVPTLQDQYFDTSTTNIIKGTVLSREEVSNPFDTIAYTIKVEGVYKACLSSSIVKLYTASSSGACGVFLEEGEAYILPIRDEKKPSISLCDVGIGSYLHCNSNLLFLQSHPNAHMLSAFACTCFPSPCRISSSSISSPKPSLNFSRGARHAAAQPAHARMEPHL